MLLQDDSFLKHKVKSEQDLFIYIKNRIDKISNYSLLLGAGASATSGVKTGQELVDEWRKDLYIQNKGRQEDYSIELARTKLKEAYGRNYDAEKEYSSLFKLKYDLPSQRRNFVEKELSNSTLSIGYRYLANLVEANYFNTIFTTNFDQLIELALLQADLKLNPIVCSHDASISSIPVVSNRPKVIKLHGDFLFDDIKTTLQETARLEKNMESKFEEFLKNFGLIVIGYSGRDDSIMDILERLIAKDGYFDGGLYWCIRQDTEVFNNVRLSKLLHNDKAFVVKIDGFDEFMANLNNSINDKEFDKNPYKIKKEKITYESEIETMKRTFPNHAIIQRDCANIEQSDMFRALRNYESLESKQSKEPKIYNFIKDDKLRKLVATINDALINNEEEKVLNLIAQHIENNIDAFKDPIWFNRLIQLKVEILHKRFRYVEAVKSLDELQVFNDKHSIEDLKPITTSIKLLLEGNLIEKAYVRIQKALANHPQAYYLYILSAEIKEKMYGYNNITIKASDIIKDYEQSINLNPSVRCSPAYLRLAQFVLSSKSCFNEFGEEKFKNILLQPFEIQNQKDPDYVEILMQKIVFDIENNPSIKKSKIEELKQIYKKNINGGDCHYQSMLLNNYLRSCRELGEETLFLNERDNAQEYTKNTVGFIQENARFYLDVRHSLKDAINVLTEGLVFDQANELLEMLCICQLYNNNIDFVRTHLHKLSPESQFGLKTDILLFEKKYNDLYNVSKQHFEESEKSIGDYMKYSYHLLICSRYDECISLLEHINSQSDVLTINYELARIKTGKALRKEKIENIYDRNVGTLKAGAAVLLNRTEEAERILINEKTKNYLYYCDFKKYPIFKDIVLNTKR